MKSDRLATLLGSDARASVLRTLLSAAGGELHTREIARQAETEYRSVWQELDRLEKLGLLSSRREGKRRLWRTTDDNRLLEALAELFHDQEEGQEAEKAAGSGPPPSIPLWLEPVLDKLRCGLIELYGGRFVGLWLYGSQARGEAREDSDVDVIVRLVGTVNPGPEIDRMAPLLSEINLETGVLLAVIPVADHDFRTEESAFWRSVREHGVAA